MESFRIGKQRFLKEVSTSVIRVDEPLYNAFTEFVKSDRRLGLTIEMLGADEEYARMQLREEMATALYSNEIGQQVLLENDPQVRRALESVKDAISLIGKK